MKRFLTLALLLSSLFVFSCADEDEASETQVEETEAIQSDPQEEKDAAIEQQQQEEVKEALEERQELKKTSPHYDANWKKTDQFIYKNEGEVARRNARGDLNNESAQQIILKREGVCGSEDCGKVVRIENLNSKKEIEALVEIKWKEDGEKKMDKRVYFVPPTADLEIGCTAICKEGKKVAVKWSIVGTRYRS